MKITLGKNQLLLLSNGKLVPVEDIIACDKEIGCVAWNGTLVVNNIVQLKRSIEPIYHIISSHGRSIYCGKDTAFPIDKLTKEFTDVDTLISLPGDHRGSPIGRMTKVIKNIPIFGKMNVNEKYLDIYGPTLIHEQSLRPNQYIEQYVSLIMSEFTKEALTYIMEKYILPLKTIKHLTTQSKNILMMLLSRLSIDFDGQVPGHSALVGSGSLRILGKSEKQTKEESLRYSGPVKQNGYQLTLENDYPLILNGVPTCQK